MSPDRVLEGGAHFGAQGAEEQVALVSGYSLGCDRWQGDALLPADLTL